MSNEDHRELNNLKYYLYGINVNVLLTLTLVLRNILIINIISIIIGKKLNDISLINLGKNMLRN